MDFSLREGRAWSEMNRLESARAIDVPALLAPKTDANLMKIGTVADD
jgi:hypothetical protein